MEQCCGFAYALMKRLLRGVREGVSTETLCVADEPVER